jgi:exodeoxyribonuclease V gamma subunit
MNRTDDGTNRVQVWYSNQLERLVTNLVDNLRSTSTGSSATSRLFQRPAILVPNQNIETYLRYEIAKTAGIAAALEIQFVEKYMSDLLSKADQTPVMRLAGTDVLRGIFLDILGSNSLPTAVARYVETGGDEPQARALRRYQLAVHLAKLAGRYADARPEMIEGWKKGQSGFVGDPHERTERWQRDLWLKLEAPNGPIEWAKIERGIEWVEPARFLSIATGCLSKLVEPVHLFGFSYLTHRLHSLLRLLSHKVHVHVYVPSPVIHLDEDLVAIEHEWAAKSASKRHAGRQSANAKSALRSAAPDRGIFQQWGKPGREFFQLLDATPNLERIPEFEPVAADSTLGRLQNEILRGVPDSGSVYHRDPSLSILACGGIRREAEAVANRIWQLLANDSKGKRNDPDRLRFRDIAVLIADSAKRPVYQAHLRAVFDELYQIPFNMIDLPLAGECQTIEAILMLLDLPLGEFTRPELLRLLTHPAVSARFENADPGRWREWCLALEIVHGADRHDHEETYIDREAFHWDQGMRRLVLGTFMTGPRQDDDRVFELEGAEYLPYDVPADSTANAAQLLVLVRSLVADARFARLAELTMTEWSDFLMRMVNAYLAAENDREQRAMSRCLARIHALRELDVAGRRVGYRIIKECLHDSLNRLTVSRGHYLADGVVISPLLEMRALPFRVIFLCGLGEGCFPTAASNDPLDLTQARPQKGDVPARDRDRYLFLETLACAREKLYMSFISRDAQTGDKLEPSPLIHDLIRHLVRNSPGTTPEDWIETQPLHRFDRRYFAEDLPTRRSTELLVNVGQSAWRESNARLLRESLGAHLGQPPRLSTRMLYELPEGVRESLGLCQIETGRKSNSARPLEISFRDIRQFLHCPLQGWARLMLRLSEEDDEDEWMREDEPFALPRFEESALLRAVFLEAINTQTTGDPRDGLAELYDVRSLGDVRKGRMPAGLFRGAERRRHLATLEKWHDFVIQKNLSGSGRFAIHRFGRAREGERVDHLQSAIPFDVPIADSAGGSRIVPVRLYGRTELVTRDLPGSLIATTRDKAQDKDFLGGFLDAVILGLLPGHHNPDQYHVHVISTSIPRADSANHRILRNIDEQSARNYLTGVLADLLGGPHEYLLPCEAVFESFAKDSPIREIVEKLLENDRSPCSSRYGPVTDIEPYSPPDEEQARAMIERRFGLFRDRGGLGE